MRKIFLAVLCLFCFGCAANSKYPGWEYVRIEKSVPSDKCQYKIQEACSEIGANLYVWFKKRATKFGANTVVITDMSKSQTSSGSAAVVDGFGGGGYDSHELTSALADYYYCPNNEECGKK